MLVFYSCLVEKANGRVTIVIKCCFSFYILSTWSKRGCSTSSESVILSHQNSHADINY